jgi:hypothetical protein
MTDQQSEFIPTIDDIGREVICLPRKQRAVLCNIKGTIAYVQLLDRKIPMMIFVGDLRLTLRSLVDRKKTRPGTEK